MSIHIIYLYRLNNCVCMYVTVGCLYMSFVSANCMVNSNCYLLNIHCAIKKKKKKQRRQLPPRPQPGYSPAYKKNKFKQSWVKFKGIPIGHTYNKWKEMKNLTWSGNQHQTKKPDRIHYCLRINFLWICMIFPQSHLLVKSLLLNPPNTDIAYQ